MNDSFGNRLQKARISAGYQTADEALERFGTWNPHTYKAHESGSRVPKTSTLEKYAKAFKVRIEWLALNSGAMKEGAIEVDRAKVVSGGATAGYTVSDNHDEVNRSLDALVDLYARTDPRIQSMFDALRPTIKGGFEAKKK